MHHYLPDDATALEKRLAADDVSFPPTIGSPHNDGKVNPSAQTTEGNYWGL